MTPVERELLSVIRTLTGEVTTLKARVDELEARPRQVILDGSCPAEVIALMEGIQDGMARVEHELANLKGHVRAIDERSGSKSMRAYDLQAALNDLP